MSSNLNGARREQLGSRGARKLRAQGRIPANIQGEGKPHADIHIDQRSFLAARRKHEKMFDIDLGDKSETVLIKEMQYDAFGDQVIHVEFRRVTRGVPIEAEVEVHFEGQARGGVLQVVHHLVKIKAIPSKIPDEIRFNAEALKAHETVKAKDLQLPEGVSLISAPDFVLAIVADATKVDAPPPAAAEGEAPKA
jgi:large subunit ribosomal protein L25